MRHRKTGVKLNRTTSHRQAMFRNMVTSLLKHDRIRTTDVKAKELRKWADHIITLAKRGDLHARRQALSIVREKDVVHKLFAEVADRFGSISGGYTRIVKIGRRPGDAAPISMIELVSSDERTKKAKKKAKPAAKKQTKAEAPAVEPLKEAPAAEAVEESVAPAQDSAPEAVETAASEQADTPAETENADASEPADAAAPVAEAEAPATDDDAEKTEDTDKKE